VSTVTRNPSPDMVASPNAVAFLAELATLPAVHEGSFEEVARLVCRRCLQLVDARYVSVWVMDPDRTHLRTIARYDSRTGETCPEIQLPIDNVADEIAALEQDAYIVCDDALTDPRLTGYDYSYLQASGVTSMLEHIIRVSGKTFGLISFERTGAADPWHSADIGLAAGTCSYLALTEVNRRNAALERQAAGSAALEAAILENAGYAVIATDIDGIITFFNRAAEEMLGYKSADIVGRASPAIFHDPAEVAAQAVQISAQLKTEIKPGFEVFTAKSLYGEKNVDEWTYIRRDGSRLKVLLSVTVIRDKNGAAIGYLGIASDVTEHNEAASRLRQSEEMLSRVLLQSPDTILITALKDGRILEANPGFEQLTGCSRAEAIGRTTLDINMWIDLDQRNEMLNQVRTFGEVRSMPLRIRRRPDDVRICVTWGRKLEYKGVPALLSVGHDITEQLRSEEQLRASEEKLRALFALSPLGINLQTMDGRYIEANDAFLSIVGYSSEEIKALTCYDLMPEEYLADEPVRMRRLRETGLIPAYEKAYRRKDGSLVPVSTATVLVTGADGQEFKWTIVEDIAVRRQAEEAQRRLNSELERLVAERTAELQSAVEGLMRAEKLASLGSLVAGVAHEISTPVGNASLATSTLANAVKEFAPQLEGKLTRSALEAFLQQVKLGVDIANRNIERVANLIQSFKQVAVDQTSSQRRQFQLAEVVDEILTTMHPSLRRAGVTADIAIDPNLILDSYPGPLGQVLTNLINNALIHAFPKENQAFGESRRICIRTEPGDGQSIRIEVSDNGIGIAPASLGRIFDPFFTSRLGQGGSGLGLHIVYNIVTDILAGTIVVASELGHGTTFSIHIPRIAPATPNPGASS
jgi:PAS domain S-box-containing protein